ncbi:hypothetical protein PO909_016303 [Leuciscus waleckii]
MSVLACETTEILTFTGYEGGKVEIRCPYESRYEEQNKYLCRGECPVLNKDIPVESGSPAKDRRFSLTDDRTTRIFTVTITDLRTEDQGKYWCSVRTGLGTYDKYTEINLEIKPVLACETTEILTFTGYEGGKVEIRCPYESGYEEQNKYLCRGECPVLNKDIPVESGSPAKDRRFSLTDDRTTHIFTVTITDLRTEDQGKHWCGVRTGLGTYDKYTEINLEIKPVLASETTEILTFTGYEGGKVEIRCPYESGYEEQNKYLCRGECSVLNKDIPVESGSPAKDRRFSLTDDRTTHIFTVTITDLRTEDQGKYWCGVRTGRGKLDKYTEINLEIKPGKSEYSV